MNMSITSRYGDKRKFELNNDILTVECYNVIYYSFSLSTHKKIVSIDPDGGPYLGIGNIFYFNDKKLKIIDIIDYQDIIDKKKLVITLKVEEIN